MKKERLDKKTILVADSCAGGLDMLKQMLGWVGEYEVCYLADGKITP